MADTFYQNLPVHSGFVDLIDPTLYQPLPDDWAVGLTDVVSSTAAIAAGRYKSVNMAGAAVVAALMNALDYFEFPYVFGGDGASFAVRAEDIPWAREALMTTASFARDELELDLRAALVPVSDILAAGQDVRVARYAPSEHVSYAMFRGGGIAWAEQQMKAGAFLIPAARVGARPELTGLSCRWNASPSRLGVILSAIIQPVAGDTPAFQALMRAVLDLASDRTAAASPFASTDALSVRWPSEGFDLEARAIRTQRESRWSARLQLYVLSWIHKWAVNGNRRLGGFDPARYKNEIITAADFRKYDDGLRFTLDCTLERADAIEALLMRAEAEGIARFGLHRQDSAIMTCFVPAAVRTDHVHFVDGAAGGYAAAAQMLKDRAG